MERKTIEEFKEESNRSVWKSYNRNNIIELLNSFGFDADIYDYYDSDKEKNDAIKNGSFRSSLFRVLARKR